MPVAALHLANLIDYAETRGLAAPTWEAVLASSDVDLQSENALVQSADYYAVLGRIAEALKDNRLGLHFGLYLNLKTLGLIYHISQNVSSFGEALIYLKEFLATTFPLVQILTTEKAGFIEMHVEPGAESLDDDLLNRHISEATLAIMYRETQVMTGGTGNAYITLPVDPDERYSAFFDHQIRKGRGYALCLEGTLISSRLDVIRRLHLEELVPKFLEMIERTKQQPDTLSLKVRRTLLNLASPTLPAIDRTASVLNMSTRTLQRKLREEGTSYRELLQEIKRELAQYYLFNKSLSVQEIAFALGYAEPSSFIHACKRWHAATPKQMKRTLERPGIPVT